MDLRRGGPDDVPLLEPLWVGVHRHHQQVMPHLAPYVDDATTWRERAALYRQLLAKPGTTLLLAEDGGQPIGYGLTHVMPVGDTWLADTWRTGDPVGQVESLAVATAHRGRGIGSRLLEALLADLTERGVRDVVLGVLPDNDGAIALYRRFGFRPVWTYLARLDGRE